MQSQASRLNEDVWSIILSLVQLDDARSLSLTSRAIHPIARCIVLSHVETSRSGHLAKICAFMSGDPRSRASWLRELHIHYEALARALALPKLLFEQLAGLLAETRNLRVLVLPLVDRLLEVEPRIGDALVSLEGLQIVTLTHVESRTLDVASRMQSRPRTVTLAFGFDTSVVKNLVALSHLALFRSAHTLHLKGYKPQMSEILGQDPFIQLVLGQLGQLPTVREVHLSDCEACPLFYVFPNLQRLEMLGICQPLEFSLRNWMWPASVPLADVAISFEDLIHFTRAPIRRLLLHRTHDSSNPIVGRLADALQFARPVCLSFDFSYKDHPHSPSNLRWIDFFRMILRPSVGRLRCLELTFDCRQPEDDQSLWMDWLLPAVTQSSLLCMRLNFKVGKTPEPSSWQRSMQNTARRVAENVPLAQFICTGIKPGWPRANVRETCTWWRVRGENASQRCVESMSNEAGEQVERYMRSAAFEQKLSLDGFVFTGA
ncbi:uncharacterized protein B0H18DRAFT_1214889 [Fomitopsis serialis]|uniref:uncharacterized protein n=1 Tax=Fomitopsis serialis TaxID=139415 RepID=UPI002007F145|nr:uncharacterized protein B0H18DRAFT_1214889 [Neoantrodia serialis]KAH9916888.1 hypothetical protein B0H18DRAFT_1214889 [Neoantrodia serialis]